MIKVGFLGIGLKRHSTGYLSRDIIAHMDPEIFDTHYYLYENVPDDVSVSYFGAGKNPSFHVCAGDPPRVIADQIKADGIHILVYLDAATRPSGVEVCSYQPAPIQISWLGGDSPGIPEIGYLFAERHLIPDPSAYREEILYLPSYCAIESLDASGSFDMQAYQKEINIGDSAQVLWSAAPGFKRSDATIEAHCRILQSTSNSYLVVKGVSELDTLVSRYRKYSDPMMVTHRIRFLAMSASEEVHRSQMAVADLFLDSWPYSASTHAVEALALGIPVLTIPSNHYYGRQASSLLTVSGLEDLIAKDPQDYVEKAVELMEDRWAYEQVWRRVKAANWTSPAFQPRWIRREMESHFIRLAKGIPS